MYFVTDVLTGCNIEASSICCTFETGEYDAEHHRDQDWSGHARMMRQHRRNIKEADHGFDGPWSVN